jgi:diphthamide biosynthesis protein 3
MSTYEEVELLDMDLDEAQEVYTYPCPCGDKFFITIDDLLDNEDKAKCPSCSLILKVQYDPEELEKRLLDETSLLHPNEPSEEGKVEEQIHHA